MVVITLSVRSRRPRLQLNRQRSLEQPRPDQAGRQLAFVTVVPKAMMYAPGTLNKIDIKKANRWLKDAMKPVGKRTMLGSADLGWETRRRGKYLQVHWHLAMWT